MPAWNGSLTPREIERLSRYLAVVTGRSTRSADGKRATRVTPQKDPWLERTPSQYRAHGKALFKEACAGCHALADADAHGTRVDLDAALGTVGDKAAWVRRALRSSPAMPDWTIRLRKSEIDALVLYVSDVAGENR